MRRNISHSKNASVMRLLTMLAVLAAFLFLMAGCGSGDTEETEATEATETVQEETAAAENWYDSVLADATVTDEYPYYRLLDIDQDGTDELFLSSTKKAFIGNEDKVKMMAFVEGEAATIKEIGGAGGESFSYDASDKSLFYFSRLSGEEHIVKYAYENGELTEEQTGDEYDDGHDPQTGSNTEDTYYLDGKKVTEREADVLWDQFDDQAMPITYSTDGQGSPYGDDDADEPNDGDDDGDDDGYDD